MNPKLCPQFSRVAIVSSITPGTGHRYNGSGFSLSLRYIAGLTALSQFQALPDQPPPKKKTLLSALFFHSKWQLFTHFEILVPALALNNMKINTITSIH